MKKLTLMLLVAFAISLVPAAGWAASPWTQETTTKGKIYGKLDFGFKNLFGGPLELVREPLRQYRAGERNPLPMIGKGLYNGVVYTVGGALHLITFPITNVDVPLPNDGVHFE